METKIALLQNQDLETQQPSAAVEVMSSRAVAQLQSAMAIAKKFPRDEGQAMNRIKAAAGRKKAAEQAEYEYRKGGTTVGGPSIRAAEVVAQAWGNILSGITEVSRDNNKRESSMLAYAADLETNNWKFVEWTVPHTQDRSSANGGAKALDSSRDIYERVMNDGSRRLRNCILAVIPGDVTEVYLEEANKTISQSSEPLVKRIDQMYIAMKEFNVTQPMIENKMQCKMSAISERQLAQLRRIYQSIKDGFGKVEDFFEKPDLTDAFKKQTQAAPAVATATEAPKVKEPDFPDAPNESHRPEPGDFDSTPAGPVIVPQQEPKAKTKSELVTDMMALAQKLGINSKTLGILCRKDYGKEPAKMDEADLIKLNASLLDSLRKAGKNE